MHNIYFSQLLYSSLCRMLLCQYSCFVFQPANLFQTAYYHKSTLSPLVTFTFFTRNGLSIYKGFKNGFKMTVLLILSIHHNKVWWKMTNHSLCYFPFMALYLKRIDYNIALEKGKHSFVRIMYNTDNPIPLTLVCGVSKTSFPNSPTQQLLVW